MRAELRLTNDANLRSTRNPKFCSSQISAASAALMIGHIFCALLTRNLAVFAQDLCVGSGRLSSPPKRAVFAQHLRVGSGRLSSPPERAVFAQDLRVGSGRLSSPPKRAVFAQDLRVGSGRLSSPPKRAVFAQDLRVCERCPWSDGEPRHSPKCDESSAAARRLISLSLSLSLS